uniref:MHD domain-containing protein n=1 Tax=Glossina morsitans morsitans TaxID=37546 RepID=A0A1B0FLY2_GLOMM
MTISLTVDGCQFLQSVKLSEFEPERSICFTPLDGEIELMRYRTTKYISLPFRVIPLVREGTTKVCVSLLINVLPFVAKIFVFINHLTLRPFTTFFLNVCFQTPLKKPTARTFDLFYAAGQLNIYHCHYIVGTRGWAHQNRCGEKLKLKHLRPSVQLICLKIMVGMKETRLSVEIESLETATKQKWTHPPISMNFEVHLGSFRFKMRYLKKFNRRPTIPIMA